MYMYIDSILSVGCVEIGECIDIWGCCEIRMYVCVCVCMRVFVDEREREI